MARADAGFFEAFVDGDTGAENGGDGLEVALLGDAGDVGGFGDAVFLEGAVDCVAGQEGLGAEWLVGALAEVTGEAGAVDPLKFCELHVQRNDIGLGIGDKPSHLRGHRSRCR